MKERPILFSGPMVRAILEGRKTQTRRVVKPQPESRGAFWAWGKGCYTLPSTEGSLMLRHCPYGQPGDRLWVRESWCPGVPGVTTLSGKTYGVRPFPKSWTIPKTRPDGVVLKYAASWEDDGPPPMRPSIHMPRWASRITLEVVAVRVERVQGISEEDAKQEGAQRRLETLDNYRLRFSKLWDTINSARGHGWDTNPWVWVVEFRRVP